MSQPVAFDPDDDFDAIADLARVECAKVAHRVVESAAYTRASHADQTNGYIAGMMVGSLGAVVATCKPEADMVELRELLRKHMDYWFDVALSLNGRTPLEMEVDD